MYPYTNQKIREFISYRKVFICLDIIFLIFTFLFHPGKRYCRAAAVKGATMANKLGFFLAGGVIGAAAALLYAPRTGAETRALVAEKANEAMGQAQTYAGQAQQRGAQVYNDL